MITRDIVRSTMIAQLRYTLPFWSPSLEDSQRIHQLVSAPLRLALHLPRNVPALAVPTEYGLPAVPHIRDFELVRMKARFASLEVGHPGRIAWDSLAAMRFPRRPSLASEATAALQRLNTNVDAGSKAYWLAAVRNSFRSWHMGAAAAGSSALLRSLRPLDTTFGPSLYLFRDSPAVARLRALCRFRRTRLLGEPHWLSRAPPVGDTSCRLCWSAPETIEHALLVCPAHEPARSALRNFLRESLGSAAISLRLVLGELPQGLPAARCRAILSETGAFLQEVFRRRPP